MVSNEESAYGAIKALQQVGRRVPEDVAVIGIDDHLEARARKPLLTTIHNPVYEIGTQAVNLLHQQITGMTQASQILRIPTSLTIRESCGYTRNNKLLDSINTVPITLHLSAMTSDMTAVHALSEAITQVVIAGGVSLGRQDVSVLSLHLTEAFLMSARSQNPERFLAAVEYILNCAARIQDSVQPWQEALSIIQQQIGSQPQSWQMTVTEFAHHLLHDARTLISQHIEWQSFAFRHSQSD
jgi:hypothetical protein